MNSILISRAPDNDVWGPFPQQWAVFLMWPKRCLFRYNKLSSVRPGAACAHTHTHTRHSTLRGSIPACGFRAFPHLQPKSQYSLLFFLQSTAEQVLCLLALKSVHELEPHTCHMDIQITTETPPGSTSYDNSGRWEWVPAATSEAALKELWEQTFPGGFSSCDRSGDRCCFWRGRGSHAEQCGTHQSSFMSKVCQDPAL